MLCIVVKNKSDIAAFASYKASDDTGAPAAAAAAPAPAATPAPPPPPKQAEQPKSTPPPPPPPPSPTTQQKQGSPAPTKRADGARVFATPLARKLAAEREIDISVGYFKKNNYIG